MDRFFFLYQNSRNYLPSAQIKEIEFTLQCHDFEQLNTFTHKKLQIISITVSTSSFKLATLQIISQ